MEKIKANKQLGQHFLNNTAILLEITRVFENIYVPYMPVVEVGPGMGALTNYVFPLCSNDYMAIEFDQRCVKYLCTHIEGIEAKIITADFLKTTFDNINNGVLLGNFPYNISSQIIFKMLENKGAFKYMIGMFQREVAKRVVSKPGSKDYGILSIFSQLHYTGSIVFDIAPDAFNPPPKVWSSVVVLTRVDNPVLPSNMSNFSLLVKTAFNQRRKMLRNALSGIVPTTKLGDALFLKRAEQLSVLDFIELSNTLFAN